jgi:hypothetical protein
MLEIIFCSLICALGVQDVTSILEERVLDESKATLSSELIFDEIKRKDIAADDAWLKLKDKAQYDAYRVQLKEKYIKAIGGFFEKTPLNAKVVERMDFDGYSVEKIIFESLPGVYVTANLYLPNPKCFAPPYKAMAVSCGHSDKGKIYRQYSRACVLAAKKGLACLIYDPIAQGERLQGTVDTCVWAHYHIGRLATLLGYSMAQLRIWDGIRALDYLDSRADIAHDGYGFAGHSGGGTMTSLMMAIDERIKVATPVCFISTIRDVYEAKGPQDPEQVIFGQVEIGLNHSSFVLMGGNKVRIHCAKEDFFPIEGARKTFEVVKKTSENCALGPDAYSKMEFYGRHSWPESARKSAVNWIERALLGSKASEALDLDALRESDLSFKTNGVDWGLCNSRGNICKGGTITNEVGFRSVFQLFKDDLEKFKMSRKKYSQSELKEIVDKVAMIVQPESQKYKVKVLSEETVGDTAVSKIVFVFDCNLELPAVMMRPKNETKEPVLMVGAAKKSGFSKYVQSKLSSGSAVLVVDLMGLGEIGEWKIPYFARKANKQHEECIGALLYSLGRTLVGQWASEIIVSAKYLQEQTGKKVVVMTPNRSIVAASHAYASRRDIIDSVESISPKALSWEEIIRQSSNKCGFSDAVFGALRYYDWVDLLK